MTHAAKTEQVAVQAHLAFLHERIFQTATKWPQFARMLEDVSALATSLPDAADVLILERAYVYGGDSLFAPLFPRQNVSVVDCELQTTGERDGYQRSWTDDPRCIHVKADRRASIAATGLQNACADMLLVPNVVHHVADQNGMFCEIARLLRPGGIGYIFEALVRELHQVPDDYVRYTPWGFGEMLKQHGLEMTGWTPTGGPFEVIAYCWIQALQYFPESERKDRERWFYQEHFPELLKLDASYPRNTFRPHTSFPTAYSIHFRRPQ